MGAEQLTKPQRALNLRLGFIRLLYNRYSPGTLNPKPSGCLQSLRSWHEATRVFALLWNCLSPAPFGPRQRLS